MKEIILICVVLVQMQREKTKEEEDSEANMAGCTGCLGPQDAWVLGHRVSSSRRLSQGTHFHDAI